MARADSMNSVTLDMPSVCKLAVLASILEQKCNELVTQNEKEMRALEDDGVLEGAEGEPIKASFAEMRNTSRTILELISTIAVILDKQATRMDVAYKDKGGSLLADDLKKANNAIKPRK